MALGVRKRREEYVDLSEKTGIPRKHHHAQSPHGQGADGPIRRPGQRAGSWHAVFDPAVFHVGAFSLLFV